MGWGCTTLTLLRFCPPYAMHRTEASSLTRWSVFFRSLIFCTGNFTESGMLEKAQPEWGCRATVHAVSVQINKHKDNQSKLRKHQLNSTAFKKCASKTCSCMTCLEVEKRQINTVQFAEDVAKHSLDMLLSVASYLDTVRATVPEKAAHMYKLGSAAFFFLFFFWLHLF